MIWRNDCAGYLPVIQWESYVPESRIRNLFSNVIYFKTCYETHYDLPVEVDLMCNCTCSVQICFHVAVCIQVNWAQ